MFFFKKKYVLDNYPLCVRSTANFTLLVGAFAFILIIMSFDGCVFLILTKSNLLNFPFMVLFCFILFVFLFLVVVVVKKSPPIPYPGHKDNFLFSSRSFRVLSFTFKSLISNSSCRFGWRWGSIFIFFHANSNCFCTIVYVFPCPSTFPGSFVAVVC